MVFRLLFFPGLMEDIDDTSPEPIGRQAMLVGAGYGGGQYPTP